MNWKRRLVTLPLALLMTGAVVAQEAEFGRTSGGQIDAMTKGPSKVSGSLGVTRSNAENGYEATLGGTLMRDRLWFFASASIMPQTEMMSQQVVSDAIDAKMVAQIGDRSSLTAAASQTRTDFAPVMSLPSSFLSLRYTGVISSNLFFNASFMRHSSKVEPFE
jgi:hypothetical protein